MISILPVILLVFYQIILTVLGIKYLHKLATKKAILTFLLFLLFLVLLAVILLVIISIVFLFF
ncbi:hypothetical protein KY325_05310, partial [Candidatus Woesearchaeota archaeon]|nr:hypothetical protein [Candidatus Woesearchaeota archaeon]